MSIQTNLEAVRQRIRAAANRVARAPDSITLVAVSKTFPATAILEAARAGATVFGENKVQEASAKQPFISFPLTWHLIGHLQRNKVGKALETFTMIESVDSDRLLREIDNRAKTLGKVMPVLLEVNIAAESAKTGAQLNQLEDLISLTLELPSITLEGLMTIPPFFENPEASRPYFKALRESRDALVVKGYPAERLNQLSMGMSGDFEVAIEEGATIVRVGTAIFGTRA